MFALTDEGQEQVEQMEALLSGDSDLSTQGVPTDESEIYVDLKESLEAVEMPLEIYRLYLKHRVAELGRAAIQRTSNYTRASEVLSQVRSSLAYLDTDFERFREAISGVMSGVEQTAWEEVDTLEARLME